MIRFDSVVVRYPRATSDALAGVSLDATSGALTAVVGPNGSGKSTLVRALIGRIALTRGAVLIDERDAATFERAELARAVAVITQREETQRALRESDDGLALAEDEQLPGQAKVRAERAKNGCLFDLRRPDQFRGSFLNVPTS